MKKTILAIVAACALITTARAQAPVVVYQSNPLTDIAETVGALVALPLILPIAVAEGVVAGTAEAADALLNPPVETVVVTQPVVQQPVVVTQPVVQQPVVVTQPVVTQPVVQQQVVVTQPVVTQQVVVRKRSIVVPAPAPVIVAPRPPARYRVRLR